MLHGLTVLIAEEILHHFLLVLEAQAQLLCYLILSWAQLAQQSCCELLNKEGGGDGERVLPLNYKLFKNKQLFSLGVAEAAVHLSKQRYSQMPKAASFQSPWHSFLGPTQRQAVKMLWLGTTLFADKLEELSGSQAKASPPLPCSCHAGRSAAAG